MCESSIWARYPNGQTEKIADDVLYVTQEGDEVLLRWFLKEPMRVTGRIIAVDAVKHSATYSRNQMWLSLRDGVLLSKQSPGRREDCFAALAMTA